MPAMRRNVIARSRVMLALLVASPVVSARSPAWAQDTTNTVVYYRAGSWEAFSGTAVNGGTFCGVKTAAVPDGRGMMLRFRTGNDRLILRVRKPSWTIPAGTAITVAMQFGPTPPWTLSATGEQDVVEWSIPQSAMPEFDARFRHSSVLWIGFPGGNEPAWNVSLAGSNAIGLTLGRCMRELAELAARGQPNLGQTAPNAVPSPTPNAVPSTPTQPFMAAPQGAPQAPIPPTVTSPAPTPTPAPAPTPTPAPAPAPAPQR